MENTAGEHSPAPSLNTVTQATQALILFLAAGGCFWLLARGRGITPPLAFLATGGTLHLVGLPFRVWPRTRPHLPLFLLLSQGALWVSLAVLVRPAWDLALAAGLAHLAWSLAATPHSLTPAGRSALVWLFAIASALALDQVLSTAPWPAFGPLPGHRFEGGALPALALALFAVVGALLFARSLRLPRSLNLPAGREWEALLDRAGQDHARLTAIQREFTAFREQAEVQIAERTRQLAESQNRLVEALAALRAAEASKSLFYRLLSHELRAPLATARGLITASLATAADEPAERWQAETLDDLGLLALQLDDLLGVVDDLLDLARGQEGLPPHHPAPVILGPVVSQAVEAHRPLAEPGVQWHLNLEANAVAYADPDHVQRIVTNLVNNAVKYTRAGSIGVTVASRNGAAWVGVEDTGPGIPPDRLPHLFEPLAPPAEGLPTPRPGFRRFGLGLPLGQLLAQANGGQITVQSQVGQGTAAWLALPAAASE